MSASTPTPTNPAGSTFSPLAEDSAGFDEVVRKDFHYDITTQQWGPSANHGWRSLGGPVHGTFWQPPALTGNILPATSCRPDRIDLLGAGMLAEHDLRMLYLRLERVNDTLVSAGWIDLGGQDPHQAGCAVSLTPQRHRQHPRQPRPLRACMVDHLTCPPQGTRFVMAPQGAAHSASR